MLQKYGIEFLGTLILCYVLLHTHENPFFVGFSHTAALFIAADRTYGHFNPLSVLIMYALGREQFNESLMLLGVQFSAALCIVLINLKIFNLEK